MKNIHTKIPASQFIVVCFLFALILGSGSGCSKSKSKTDLNRSADEKSLSNDTSHDLDALMELMFARIDAIESGDPSNVINIIDDRVLKSINDRNSLIERIQFHIDYLNNIGIVFPKNPKELNAKYRFLDKKTAAALFDLWGIDIEPETVAQVYYSGLKKDYQTLEVKGSKMTPDAVWIVEITAIRKNSIYKMLIPVLPETKESREKSKDILKDIDWVEFE